MKFINILDGVLKALNSKIQELNSIESSNHRRGNTSKKVYVFLGFFKMHFNTPKVLSLKGAVGGPRGPDPKN